MSKTLLKHSFPYKQDTYKIIVPEKCFFDKCSLLWNSFINDCVTVKEVIGAIMGQKKSKAAGPNGLAMETFIYGGTKIWIHLSLLYTFRIKHCFLPAHFMDIIPVIKNKGGDKTDINNYRAIAVSNADTKILEKLILTKVNCYIY